jgi:Predicted transcriptional regulator
LKFNTFDTIKSLCKSKGISVPRLEKILDFSPNSLYSWKKATPTIEKLVSIANYFEVSLEYLLGLNEVDSPENSFSYENLVQRDISYQNIRLSEEEKELLLSVSFALLNSTFKFNNKDAMPLTEQSIFRPKKENLIINDLVLADSGILNEYDKEEEIEIFKRDLPTDYTSICKVVGNDLTPVFEDKTILFIKSKDVVVPNKIGIFKINEEKYLKKLRRDYSGDYYLQSLNNMSEDIYFADNEVKIIGEVIGSYLEKESEKK